MIGFRAAGWTCVGALAISLVVAVFGLRGIGLVGQLPKEEKRTTAIELGRISDGRVALCDGGTNSMLGVRRDDDSAFIPSETQTQVDIQLSEKPKNEDSSVMTA